MTGAMDLDAGHVAEDPLFLCAQASQRFAHLSAAAQLRLQWLLQAKRLPDRSVVLDSYIQHFGPYLYHCPGDPDDLDLILDHGIRPRDAGDSGSWSDLGARWLSRPGFTYLGDPQALYSHICRLPIIQVDLMQLDPARLVADEDVFDVGCEDYNEYELWIDVLPFVWPDSFAFLADSKKLRFKDGGSIESVPDERPLADWAQQHAHILAHPASLAYSLACGVAAHEGVIAPSAIALNHELLADGKLSEHLSVYDDFRLRSRWRCALAD